MLNALDKAVLIAIFDDQENGMEMERLALGVFMNLRQKTKQGIK